MQARVGNITRPQGRKSRKESPKGRLVETFQVPMHTYMDPWTYLMLPDHLDYDTAKEIITIFLFLPPP